MQYDFSCEKEIIKGSVMFVEKVAADLFRFQMMLRDIKCGTVVVFEINGIKKCTITLETVEDVDKVSDVQQTLIGLSYENRDGLFSYCIRTDDYEIIVESNNTPNISTVNPKLTDTAMKSIASGVAKQHLKSIVNNL